MRPRFLDDSLRKAQIPYTAFSHPPAFSAQKVAALSHVPGRCFAKTVVCVADETPILAVVPATLMVDLDALRVLANAVTLRLADEAELAALYPLCEVGAVSPFTSTREFLIFVDRSLVGEPEMVFNAGTHTDAIRVHWGDFAELTRPIIRPIGRRRDKSTPAIGIAGVV